MQTVHQALHLFFPGEKNTFVNVTPTGSLPFCAPSKPPPTERTRRHSARAEPRRNPTRGPRRSRRRTESGRALPTRPLGKRSPPRPLPPTKNKAAHGPRVGVLRGSARALCRRVRSVGGGLDGAKIGRLPVGVTFNFFPPGKINGALDELFACANFRNYN